MSDGSAPAVEEAERLRKLASSCFTDSSIGASTTCPKAYTPNSKAHQDRVWKTRVNEKVKSEADSLHSLGVSLAHSGGLESLGLSEYRNSLILQQAAYERAAEESRLRLQTCRMEHGETWGVRPTDPKPEIEIESSDPCRQILMEYRVNLSRAEKAKTLARAGMEQDKEVVESVEKQLRNVDTEEQERKDAKAEAERKNAELERARKRNERERQKESEEIADSMPLFSWPSKPEKPSGGEEKGFIQRQREAFDRAVDDFIKKGIE